jgi:hypothetical protein
MKTIIIIITLFICNIFHGLESYKIKEKLICKQINILNQVEKVENYIYLNQETIDIYIQVSLYRDCIKLNKTDRSIILEAIKKYKKWHQIAISNKKTLIREIDKVRVNYFWSYINQNEWYNVEDYVISCNFFSQTEIRHQFVIDFSITNNRDDTPVLYFDYEDIESLEYILSDVFINKKLKEIEENKNLFK